MAKEKPNKWTRERGFFDDHGADIAVFAGALFFLALSVAMLLVPWHLPNIFALPVAGKPPPPQAHQAQTLTLAPGETTINLYPGQKPAQPPSR